MSLTDTFKTTPRSTLKGLVQTLNDGKEGFRQASENVKDEDLKQLFSEFSLQRSKFAGVLEAELLSLGEADPQDEGTTLSGKIHRGWIDIKGALTKADRHAVLAEAERGEDVAVKAFKDALETDLTAPLRETIAEQAAEVQLAHNTVRDLRNACAKK
jgi:uncharacterized protein (TIGR02284 family)